MVAQIKQSFRIIKNSQPQDFVAEVYCDEELMGLLFARTYQEARLAAIQYLKDHQ